MSQRIKLPLENIFEFAGAKLNYRVMGKGKPVILLHGSMVANPWFGFDERIAREYRVYLPELPGFGASETIPGRVHNTELFTEVFAEFVREIGLIRAPVIAFSLGTVVAAKAAAAGSIKGTIIMVGMPIRLESPLLKKIVELPLQARHILAQNEIARGGILLAILSDVIGTADKKFTGKYLTLLKTSDVQAIVDTNPIDEVEKDLPWILQQMKNQLWFVYGEYDKLKTGADKWLNRKMLVIPGAGHDVFAARPEQTMNLINKLLKPRGLFFRIWQHLKYSL